MPEFIGVPRFPTSVVSQIGQLMQQEQAAIPAGIMAAGRAIGGGLEALAKEQGLRKRQQADIKARREEMKYLEDQKSLHQSRAKFLDWLREMDKQGRLKPGKPAPGPLRPRLEPEALPPGFVGPPAPGRQIQIGQIPRTGQPSLGAVGLPQLAALHGLPTGPYEGLFATPPKPKERDLVTLNEGDIKRYGIPRALVDKQNRILRSDLNRYALAALRAEQRVSYMRARFAHVPNNVLDKAEKRAAMNPEYRIAMGSDNLEDLRRASEMMDKWFIPMAEKEIKRAKRGPGAKPATVRMRAPDGRIMTIPRANVEKAKKRRAVEID